MVLGPPPRSYTFFHEVTVLCLPGGDGNPFAGHRPTERAASCGMSAFSARAYAESARPRESTTRPGNRTHQTADRSVWNRDLEEIDVITLSIRKSVGPGSIAPKLDSLSSTWRRIPLPGCRGRGGSTLRRGGEFRQDRRRPESTPRRGAIG